MPHDPSDLAAELDRLLALTGIKWSRYPKGTLACWVADMDLPPAPPIVEALRGMVERGDFGYNFAAHMQLPDVWAEWMTERHGWRPDEQRVRVLTDVLQAVDLALWLGTEPGDGVVIFTPVYPPFLKMVPAIGRRIVDCPLEPGTWRLDPERLEECVAFERPRAVLLCSPHNPTGRAFTRDELRAIAEVAERHDLLVISDEIWADVVYSGARHIPFASLPAAEGLRVVTGHAASKAFNLAGLRCAVAHVQGAELEKRMAELPGHMLGGVSAPGAIATLTAWTECKEWLDETVRFMEQQRDYLLARLTAELSDVRVTTPEATYLAWLDMRAYGLGDDPAEVLLERAQVALGSGPDFGEHGKGFARLNFATSRVVLEEAIGRLVRGA
jgi:cystathionine beta-lyase